MFCPLFTWYNGSFAYYIFLSLKITPMLHCLPVSNVPEVSLRAHQTGLLFPQPPDRQIRIIILLVNFSYEFHSNICCRLYNGIFLTHLQILWHFSRFSSDQPLRPLPPFFSAGRGIFIMRNPATCTAVNVCILI